MSTNTETLTEPSTYLATKGVQGLLDQSGTYGHGLFVLYLTPRPLNKGLVEPNYEGSLNQVRSSRLRKIPKYYVKKVKLIFSTNMRFSFDGQTKILRPQSASIDSAPALSRLHLFTTHRPTPFRTHPLICALQPS